MLPANRDLNCIIVLRNSTFGVSLSSQREEMSVFLCLCACSFDKKRGSHVVYCLIKFVNHYYSVEVFVNSCINR